METPTFKSAAGFGVAVGFGVGVSFGFGIGVGFGVAVGVGAVVATTVGCAVGVGITFCALVVGVDETLDIAGIVVDTVVGVVATVGVACTLVGTAVASSCRTVVDGTVCVDFWANRRYVDIHPVISVTTQAHARKIQIFRF